jgi:ABC-type thiamin/hydroxymethylpyrimidine transport system permease subunit
MNADTETRTISLQYDLPHPPEEVWRALTDPALLATWLMAKVLGGITILLPGLALLKEWVCAGMIFDISGAAAAHAAAGDDVRLVVVQLVLAVFRYDQIQRFLEAF